MSSTAESSARDRIISLLDESSFVEIGAMITKRNTDFNLLEKETPADGVITGYGVIAGKPVYVFSQDASTLNGTIGEMHARKIVNLYDLALKVGAPVIGLIDCAGFRLQEGLDALAGFGDVYLKQTMASGIIPQITAIFGSCGGGVAVSSLLSDFTFMEEKSAKLFVNSPNAMENNYIGKLDTSTASFQAKAGVIDFVGRDEAQVLTSIRDLVAILPSNNLDEDSFGESMDDLNRELNDFDIIISDPAKSLVELSDQGQFIEVKKEFAKDMVAGFIRLNGMTVGAVANRLALLDEEDKVVETMEPVLSTDGCLKAEKFINFCDAFQIPLLSLTNVTGYKADVQEEKTIGKAAAKLTYAFANATVPKINVVVGKAYGSAYITMNSKHIGADLVFAYEESRIGMMEGKDAVPILYANEIKKSLVATQYSKEKAKEYDDSKGSSISAAKRGYVDSIIHRKDTRKHLIYGFDMLFTKRVSRPSKNHGTV